MKLEIGMYVRTLKGIAKIIDRKLDPKDYYFQCWVTDRFLCICDDTEYLCDSDILKASYNIIDLIEVGDYVNSYKILFFDKDLGGKLNIKCINNDEERICFYEEDIKDIVTKEQFENNVYRIGD